MKIKIYVKTFFIYYYYPIDKTTTINYLHNDTVSITHKKLYYALIIYKHTTTKYCWSQTLIFP